MNPNQTDLDILRRALAEAKRTVLPNPNLKVDPRDYRAGLRLEGRSAAEAAERAWARGDITNEPIYGNPSHYQDTLDDRNTTEYARERRG